MCLPMTRQSQVTASWIDDPQPVELELRDISGAVPAAAIAVAIVGLLVWEVHRWTRSGAPAT